ncbi:UXT-like protein [Chlorella sorokiniana]|uniref:UXT-like protein n=1 Tax=Chlorella sorokiniana TaxID=3076 RepID=A0A2P6TLD3_CHLSO|nr:UXT-like protein [Chlorella sorokiniana]|eukprot:PRW45056.1 UXT-like protein [Chlorella sorokiniana]
MPGGTGTPRSQRQRLVAGLLAFVAVTKFQLSLHKKRNKLARAAAAAQEAREEEQDRQASEAALAHYGAFRQRLQGDLAVATAARDQLRQEQQSYEELEANIDMLQRERMGELRALMPLGAGLHAQAEVSDASRIYVHVALGFHPELTLDEAKAAAERRRRHLEGLLDARSGEVARIRAHLRLVEQALADLAGLTEGGAA